MLSQGNTSLARSIKKFNELRSLHTPASPVRLLLLKFPFSQATKKYNSPTKFTISAEEAPIFGLSLYISVECRYQQLVFRHKLYQLREERDVKPETFASLISAILYKKRFGPYFCQPVIAGLGDEDKPFICTMDSIGAKELAKDFVVAGTASESLDGACESMFTPDMDSEELFETVIRRP
ncbi:proteasome subunit beta type-3-A [Olea europaea subsp. europaea]|uniref:Proteasome subunit beta type-3-A n=1 Tax=Olea europaea subsp. europaea TaxID=158383 RepID=A0A8S0PBM3_OLEEU|nr:proteasome subunit beta type-3-A [Olea europaea subsp. europaea]